MLPVPFSSNSKLLFFVVFRRCELHGATLSFVMNASDRQVILQSSTIQCLDVDTRLSFSVTTRITSEQQYDEFGFPLASQTQTYNNPPPQHQQQGHQQQQPHQHGSGFPGGNGVGGGASYPMGYAGQGQGQSTGGAHQAYATGAAAPPASAVTDLVVKVQGYHSSLASYSSCFFFVLVLPKTACNL